MPNEPTPKSVLIIDDDDFIGGMLAQQLQDEGFAVRRVSTGEEGLTELKKEIPNLTVLDIGLPGIDGYEVLEAIQKDESLHGVLVLVLSNFGQDEEVERSKSLGATDHLVKANINPRSIVGKVKELCEQQ